MRYSFSFIDQYLRCPFKWYLKYGLKVPEKEDYSHNHPFKIGHLLHTAIEHDIERAKEEYYNEFPIIGNEHIEEVMKVDHYSRQVKDLLPKGKHEVQLKSKEFIGFIDYLSDDAIFDFKYSNNIKGYKKSMQLHVYKYYLKEILDKDINKMYYIFVPKFKHKDRKEMEEKLKTNKIQLIEIKYDERQVDKYFKTIHEIENTKELRKNVGYQCNWCDYEKICFQRR